MKKLITALFCLVSLHAFTQVSKWFVSFTPGYTIGGPSASIRSQMNKQGFNETSSYNFFGWAGTNDHPYKTQEPSLLLRLGKAISDYKSIYFVIGRLDKAEVEGFKNRGYGDFLGILGSSDGPRPTIGYSLYQLTAGYMYSYKNSRAKLGIGPSIFYVDYYSVMNYTTKTEKQTSVVPGVSVTGRLPFGKEKKLVGLEFIFEANIAPPVKMKSMQGEGFDRFEMKSANMVSANMGIALCFRKKAKA